MQECTFSLLVLGIGLEQKLCVKEIERDRQLGNWWFDTCTEKQ